MKEPFLGKHHGILPDRVDMALCTLAIIVLFAILTSFAW